MKTTQRLLSEAKEIWDAYNEHPFVLGIQDGTSRTFSSPVPGMSWPSESWPGI